MTDGDRTDEPDARDEGIATRLQVPPLDAVTRRRLVRRTLTDVGPPGTGGGARVLRVAAVLAALMVLGGAAALVLREDGTGDRDATPRAGPTAEDPAPEALDAAPPGLADLGEVSDPAVLLQRLEAAGALDPARPGSAETADDAEAGEGADRAPVCRDTLEDLGAGSPTFVATASDGGTPVLVVVAPVAGEDAPATSTALVLETATCGPLGAVALE